MRPALRFALLLPLLAACGEGPLDPGPFTLEGAWRGRAFPYELSFSFQQDGDNNVTGQGEIRGLRIEGTEPDVDTIIVTRVPVDVRGNWGYPDFTLRLGADDFGDATLRGRFGRTDSASVVLNGSGFGNVQVPLERVTASD